MIKEILLATTNKGKLGELQQLMAGYNITLRSLNDYPEIVEPEETGDTFAKNARLKAEYYADHFNCCVLADDSGLEVDALDGTPGVYSARYGGVEGAGRDKANNAKLIKALADVSMEKRTARFRCSLCLLGGGVEPVEVSGACQGLIIDTPRGDNGFGYDPIFYLPDRDKTIAELPPVEKNAISHRSNAFRELLKNITPLLA